LGYVEKRDIVCLVKLKAILSIFTIEELKELNKIAQKFKIKQEIHIPIDAHLGREGFLEEEWVEVLEEIKKCKNIRLTGLYAHFANIEDSISFGHAEKQIKKYEKAVKLAKEFGFKNLKTHISATSGLLIYEKGTGLNSIVRLGIGVYGMWPSENIKLIYKNKMELRPVLTWKTKIAQIKTLPLGHNVGYGLTYKTSKQTKIAVISQGYADGLDRRLSNNGEVLIRGMRCQILGRVSMNMCVVDVSHLKNVSVEDEVVILGQQGKEEISAEEMAKRMNTINYEITTRISPLLARFIV
jgi:alanine racemase